MPPLHELAEKQTPLSPPQTRLGLELNSRRFARGGALTRTALNLAW